MNHPPKDKRRALGVERRDDRASWERRRRRDRAQGISLAVLAAIVFLALCFLIFRALFTAIG
jgi:hypothetical protein